MATLILGFALGFLIGGIFGMAALVLVRMNKNKEV